MGNDPLPTDDERRLDRPEVLPYRAAAADKERGTSVPWPAVIAAVLAAALGPLLAFAWTMAAITAAGSGRIDPVSIWVALATVGTVAMALALARSVERRRRGVFAGAIVGVGIALLVSGACFAAYVPLR